MSAGNHATLVALGLTLLPTCLSSQMVVRHIDASNAGHRLHMTSYERKSSSPIKRITLVFESGLGGGEAHWRRVIDRLPQGVLAITYERPG